MNTIDKIVHERIWVTEYYDTCPVPEPVPQAEIDTDPFTDHIFNYRFNLYKNTEWVFKRRYLDQDKSLKDFGNPLCRIEITRYTICLEENDDKISLKLFRTGKTRRPGVVWFSRSSDVYFITFNKKTKNIYSGHVTSYNKKKKSRKVVCNHFFNHLNQIHGQMIPLTTIVENPEYPQAEIVELERLNEIYGKFFDLMGIQRKENYFDITDDFYKKYVSDRGIKIPNNFIAFKQCGTKPPQRLFKKNDMRMVETYMQHYGLKGDKFRKILHQVSKIDFYEFKNLVDAFSIDFLLQRPEEELKVFIENKKNGNLGVVCSSVKHILPLINKKEKLNVYLSIFSQFEAGHSTHSVCDHIRFYLEIAKHEKVRWRANGISSFKKEHVEYTEKYDFYTQGHYDREFDESFVKHVEQAFIVDGVRYTPILFQKNLQYIEESSHQSNCVKTYNNNFNSIIISLRNETNERLTMQFSPRKLESGKVIWKNAQTRARFNDNPKEHWEAAINIFEQRFLSVTDFTLPKIWFINYNSRTPVDIKWGNNGYVTTLTSIVNDYGLIEF